MMKVYFASIFCLLLLFSALAQAEVLLWDDFEDGVISEQSWKINTGDLTEEDGILTMTRGDVQYPVIVTTEAFDFSNGVTFQGRMKLGTVSDNLGLSVTPTDCSELKPFPIGWFGPFVRIILDQNHPYVQSTPKGNNVDVARFAELDQVDPEESHQWAMYLEGETVRVYLDGEELVDAEHTGGFTKGYLSFGAGEATVADTTVDNVVIYTGDYDPDILKKAMAVANTVEKLSTSWGAIKNQ